MIDFSKYPRTEKMTYTVIPKCKIAKVRTALELSNETDCRIRSCSSRNKSMVDDIREHLPEWFNARHCVLISHFESKYFLKHLEEIRSDKDVINEQLAIAKEMEEDYIKHHKWKESIKHD